MTRLRAGWRSVTLGQVIKPQGARETPTKSTTLPFVGMEHVESQSGKIIGQGRGAEIASLSPIAVPGDVLYGRLRPYLNKVAIASERAYVSGEFIVFQGNADVDARWLKWRLSALDFVEFAIGLNTGDRPRVKWPQMAAFPLLLPPLDEQRRIVAIFEDHLSRLDAATASIAAASRRAELLLTSALAGLAKPGDPVASLGDLAEVGTGSTPSRADSSNYDGGTIPWVTSGDISKGRIVTIPQAVTTKGKTAGRLKLYQPETLVVAMYGEGKTRGTVGRLGVAATMNQACAAVQVRDPEQLDWIEAVLRGNYLSMRRMAAGGVQPNLNLSLVRSIPIPLPALADRGARMERLRASTEAVTRVRESVAASGRRGAALRRSLLAAAFRGELGA